MNWYLDVLKKYAVFEGRARRKEYWMFALFNFIIIIALAVIDALVGTLGAFGGLYSLATLVPVLAVSFRRLHDTGKSGWWLLICFVPIVGVIILFIFTVMDSTPGDNQYGKNPKEAAKD